MKKIEQPTAEELAAQDNTSLAREIIENLVGANNQSSNIGEQLAEIVSFTNENPLTEELGVQINALEGEDLATLKPIWDAL